MAQPWEDSSFNEQSVSDLETARLALRWALDKVRRLEEDRHLLKQELQEKNHQMAFLERQAQEQRLKGLPSEGPALYNLQEEVQRLNRELKQKEAEIETLLEVQGLLSPQAGPAAPPQDNAQKSLEILGLKREVEALRKALSEKQAPLEERERAWTEQRLSLLKEFRTRAERLEIEHQKRSKELGDIYNNLKIQLVRRQQEMLDREWKRLHEEFLEKGKALENERKRLEALSRSLEADSQSRLDARRRALEAEFKQSPP